MKARRIKRVFDKVFKYPNPIFCIPVLYFRHNNFLCEVAATKTMSSMRWNNYDYKNKSPLLILEALFVDQGFWITVLERKDRQVFVHRQDLCGHIDSKRQLNNFINSLDSNETNKP